MRILTFTEVENDMRRDQSSISSNLLFLLDRPLPFPIFNYLRLSVLFVCLFNTINIQAADIYTLSPSAGIYTTGGNILKLKASITGTSITFTVTKQDGSLFQTAGVMTIRTDESNGCIANEGNYWSFSSGVSTVQHTFDLTSYVNLGSSKNWLAAIGIPPAYCDGTPPVYYSGILNLSVTPSTPPPTGDTTSPSISISSPAPNYATTSSSVRVSGSASDDTGVVRVSWTSPVGSGDATGTTDWFANVTLQDGDNTITARAYDAAGNYRSNSILITKTTAPPITTNKEPTFISGGVNNATVTEKGSLQLKAVFKDPESNPIIGVKARYRLDTMVSGSTWTEIDLPYEYGSADPTFSKTVAMDVPAGNYEFQFQASDVDQLGGTILHTTAWQGRGTFTVTAALTAATNHAPIIKNWKYVSSVVKKCQPYSMIFTIDDIDKNSRELQINWTSDTSTALVTSHLVSGGETITVTSPVTQGSCPSELTNKPDTTLVKWSATAYDSLGAKSTMVKGGVYVGHKPVNIGSGACYRCKISHVADPVNTATGSEIVDLKPLTVNGALPLSFSLSYDSAVLDSNGILGKVWSTDLISTRLEKDVNGDVIIRWSDSQYNSFFLQGDGSYFSEDQRTQFDSLVKNPDGSFTLTRQSKAIYEFNAAGQLQVIRNPQGQRLTFEYNSAGKMSKVIEPVSGVFLSYAYNAAGLLESVSDPLNRKVSLAYNAAGFLEKITDAAGQFVTYSYDSAGRILKSVNSDNNVLFINTYDANGRVATQDDGKLDDRLWRFAYSQDADGNDVATATQRDNTTRVYTYDGAYQLLSIKDELNGVSTAVYDPSTGSMLESMNPKGAKTQLKYDDKGNVISGTNAKGASVQASYDAFNNPLSMTDTLGNKSAFVYNDKQLLINATNALNQVTTYAYNSDNQLSTIISPKAAVTQLEYVKGLLSKTTGSEGQVTVLTRDAVGRVTKITDAENHSTEFVWDGVNRLLSVKDALGRVVKFTYNARDKVTSITDAKGNVTLFDYDSNGNRTKVTNALGQVVSFEHDAEDRLIKVIDALNQSSQVVRDAKGRVVKTIDALGKVREVQYDLVGNVTKSIDALGQITASLDYDILDNITKATDGLGNVASAEYDQLDRVVKSIDPLNRTTEYQYDSLSRLEKSVDALKGLSSQAFDADGLLSSFKDPNQNETRAAFDKSARMIEQTTTTGGKLSYRYNPRNLLIELKNARGQVRNVEYDAVGRITKLTDEVSSRAYQYDDNDNLLTVTDSVAGKVSFTYDKLNRVLTYTDAYGDKIGYAYDVVGNIVVLTYPDGRQVKYTYDARGSMTSVTDWAKRVTRYEWDANARLVKETRPNGSMLTRRYDALGRLIEAKDVSSAGNLLVSFSYRYDAVGNIIEEQMSPEPDFSSVRAMMMEYGIGNSITKVDGQATSLDLDGNLVKAPLNGVATDFVFNARNQLTSAASLTYGYDALGYRDSVTEKGKTTRYVLNPVPALHQALVKVAPDGKKTFYVYGLGLIGEESEGAYLNYHFDYRGSTVLLTAQNGKDMGRFTYEPYGGLLSHDVSLASTTPFLFNGRYGVMTDSNGLYQMRARFYHPELRRFVNQDPVFLGSVGDSQSLNRFAFVTGQPVSLVDPFGLKAIIMVDPNPAYGNGHAAIAIQQGDEFLFYNFYPKTGDVSEQIKNKSSDGIVRKGTIKAGQVADYAQSFQTFLVIRTTKEQDAEMIKYIDKYAPTPSTIEENGKSIPVFLSNDKWNLYSNNCGQFVVDVLNNSLPVKITRTLVPNLLIDTAEKEYNSKFFPDGPVINKKTIKVWKATRETMKAAEKRGDFAKASYDDN